MSKAETANARRDFQLRIANFKRVKDTRAARVYGKLEPTVIDNDLLLNACFAQGPTGEAGKIAELEGIAFSNVKRLSLSYQNILKVGYLEQFLNITELSLDNNIIEKIQGIETLVNIVRLDLSFNKISLIENLSTLGNLEDLSLFSNEIEVIKNLDENKKLKFLSMGRNRISNLQNILYLRRFKNLDCLTIDNNPICDEDGYEVYIFAFLERLKYLDYKEILPQWRAKAYEKYQISVDQMNEAQHDKEALEAANEEREIFMEECRSGFIDKVVGDNLFDEICEKDPDSPVLFRLPSVIELVEQYKEKLSDASALIYKSGQDEHKKRRAEEETFRSCIGDAKLDSKRRARLSIERYEEIKKAIQKKVDEIYQDSFPEVAELLLRDHRQAIYDLWNDLMGNEVGLVDQLEEVITEFGRNMDEMVSNFVENIQLGFAKAREAASAFNERLSEMVLTYAERLSKTEQPTEEQEKSIFMDRDALLNAITNSKEINVLTIDRCEEHITKSIRAWCKTLVEDIHQTEEYDRHSNRVTEINLYIDAQRVELETADLSQI